MTQVMRFVGPGIVDVIEVPALRLLPGQARVRTIVSGVSAGTELTAYRGTNPYLTATWDPDLRLFSNSHPGMPSYPLEGWGYSEVGEVVEVGPGSTGDDGDVGDVAVGDLVWGIWGHRSEGVLPAAALRDHQLPRSLDPAAGCFVRVGAIALNAVLEAENGIGDTVVIFGQGVIGLLATHYATIAGSTVIAVDAIPARRDAASALGARHVLAPGPDIALEIRDLTQGRGADQAIELSGSYHALREAVRAVAPDSAVVAAGFYQGPATALHLGEEFHHNRARIIASQIGSVPPRLRPRWDRDRLQYTVVTLLTQRSPDVVNLVSHRFPIGQAADAFRLLDQHPEETLQVLLEFG